MPARKGIRVTAPVDTFTGTVAGVAFVNGTATADEGQDAAALAYFRRRGYTIESGRKASTAGKSAEGQGDGHGGEGQGDGTTPPPAGDNPPAK